MLSYAHANRAYPEQTVPKRTAWPGYTLQSISTGWLIILGTLTF